MKAFKLHLYVQYEVTEGEDYISLNSVIILSTILETTTNNQPLEGANFRILRNMEVSGVKCGAMLTKAAYYISPVLTSFC